MHNLGQTRSSQQSNHLLLTADTFVRTTLPGMKGCAAVVHAGPAMGARFTQYTAEVEAGGELGSTPAQRFVFVIEGGVALEVGGKRNELAAGGYAYLPEGVTHRVLAAKTSRVAVIEKSYQALVSVEPPRLIVSNENAVYAAHPLGDDPDLQVKCLLPDEMSFDFAVNTMTYQPGAALSMVEMHVMEHGLIMLEGGGIYRLGDSWYPVTAGDFIWMGPWCPQWFGALGKVPAKYLIYKDWNRHPLAVLSMNLEIDRDRLISEIEALAAISDGDPPAVTRIVFTPADLKARAWLRARCEEAGLSVRQDAIGNTFARWNGSDPAAPAVGTGSHIDAIPNAGKYDGVVGVLGGLEAIRALQRSGFHPTNSLELLVFTSEEPTRFGIGCLGSRLLSGSLSVEAAKRLTDNDGKSIEDVRSDAGLHGHLDEVKLPDSYYKAFVELHIEQGPILERQQTPLGVVTSIAAPASMRIVIEGAGGHAGGVLMPDRRDALCAAAELILAIENAARSSGAVDTVATVGICEVFPGAVNSIPIRVRLSADIRDTDLERRDGVIKAMENACNTISANRKVAIHIELLNADAPAQCAPSVVEALSGACSKHQQKFLSMVSRAYHDSLFMSRIAPTAMLFIPCRNGYSHRPDEYASPEDIARGALILAEALATLSE